MRILETPVYKLAELSPAAQSKAYDKWNAAGACDGWEDFVTEDAAEIAKIFGIYDIKIMFSGFWSQGDGACFTGGYSYEKGAAKAIRAHAPEDTVLHGIADALQKAQAAQFYKLAARLTHRERYYHDRSVTIDVEHTDRPYTSPSNEIGESISEPLRAFMRWIYKALQAGYEHATSEESFKETAEANDYEFTADGTMI